MKLSVSIWWCYVRDEPVAPDKCAYHAPELGCGNVPVHIDGMIWKGDTVIFTDEEENDEAIT